MLSRRTHVRPAGRSDDAGAVAILVAISMTAILLVVAMVIDFGIVRLDRTINKASADAAAAAGVRSLESGDGRARGWAGACTALAYLRVNNPEYGDLVPTWQTGLNAPVTGDPCAPGSAYLDQGCERDDRNTWAVMTGSAAEGRLQVEIRSGYVLSQGGFSEESLDALVSDTGDPVQGGCDHLAVIVQETKQPAMGSIVSVDELVTRVRSVARVTIGDQGQAVVALVLLERETCPTLSFDGSTVNFVSGGYLTRPGMIHSDSRGANCGNKRIFQVEQGIDRILAEHAETGSSPRAAGVIGSVALTGVAGTHPEAVYSGGPGERVRAKTDAAANVPIDQQVPTARPLIGRRPVDARYLTGVRQVAAAAQAAWSSPPPAGWLVLNTCTLDGGVNGGVVPATVINVYVNCNRARIDAKAFEINSPGTVVFNRPVTVAGGDSLRINDAQRVYVNGDLKVPSGVLRVNAPGASDCIILPQPSPDRARAALVVNGSLEASISASLHLCSTTVVLANCPIPVTAGTPPADNACRDTVNVQGQAVVRWTAPDAIGANPQPADHQKLEDLALWGEASGPTNSPHKLGGQGALRLAGVFFLPNANAFEAHGGSGMSVDKAQFVVRRLILAGTSTFLLRPDPEDSVTLPYFGDFSLVR
jgi:hypothetical protein